MVSTLDGNANFVVINTMLKVCIDHCNCYFQNQNLTQRIVSMYNIQQNNQLNNNNFNQNNDFNNNN